MARQRKPHAPTTEQQGARGAAPEAAPEQVDAVGRWIYRLVAAGLLVCAALLVADLGASGPRTLRPRPPPPPRPPGARKADKRAAAFARAKDKAGVEVDAGAIPAPADVTFTADPHPDADRGCGIHRADTFLSPEEIRHILKLVDATGWASFLARQAEGSFALAHAASS